MAVVVEDIDPVVVSISWSHADARRIQKYRVTWDCSRFSSSVDVKKLISQIEGLIGKS